MRPSVCYPSARRRYSNDLPALFNAFFDNLPTTQHNVGHVNVAETDLAYEVEVALPGMAKEDFKVKVDNNILTVSAEKTVDNTNTENNRKYIRREFNYSSFKRNFTLPENVDTTAIKAQYNNGVLVVTLPKKSVTEPTTKTIEIN